MSALGLYFDFNSFIEKNYMNLNKIASALIFKTYQKTVIIVVYLDACISGN